jgi:adenylate cyclase
MLSGALQQLGRHDECLQVTRQALPVVERHIESNPDDDAALGRAAILGGIAGRARARGGPRGASRQRPARRLRGLYNAACAYACISRRDRALELLDQAVRHGRGHLAWIEHDEDLASLRGDPRFDAILKQLRTANGSAPA